MAFEQKTTSFLPKDKESPTPTTGPPLYTSERFLQALKDREIQISMDGKGAWRDNIFVERLWRSVKYEDIYLHAYETPSDVKQGLKRYFQFYNTGRPHQAHRGQTPDTAYFHLLPVAEVA